MFFWILVDCLRGREPVGRWSLGSWRLLLELVPPEGSRPSDRRDSVPASAAGRDVSIVTVAAGMASSLEGESGSRAAGSLFCEDVAWFFLSESGEPESDRSASKATASRPSRSMSYAYGSPELPCFEKDWSMSISSSSIAVGWGGHAWCSIVVRPVTLVGYFGFRGARGGPPPFSDVSQPFPVALHCQEPADIPSRAPARLIVLGRQRQQDRMRSFRASEAEPGRALSKL